MKNLTPEETEFFAACVAEGMKDDSYAIEAALRGFRRFTLGYQPTRNKLRRMSMRIAAEFGFKAHEAGENLELMLSQFDVCMRASDELSSLKLTTGDDE